MKPFKKISVRNFGYAWGFWIGTTMARKARASFTERDFDTGVQTLMYRLEMPKRVWYYRVRVMTLKVNGHPRRQVRIERMSRKQEEDLMPWSEAFQVWCTYARLL